MGSLGIPELIILLAFSVVVPLWVAYHLIKAAVRNGVVEALEKREAGQVRGELGLGGERSPNSRS
jgi:hypothetical protein